MRRTSIAIAALALILSGCSTGEKAPNSGEDKQSGGIEHITPDDKTPPGQEEKEKNVKPPADSVQILVEVKAENTVLPSGNKDPLESYKPEVGKEIKAVLAKHGVELAAARNSSNNFLYLALSNKKNAGNIPKVIADLKASKLFTSVEKDTRQGI